MVAEVLEAGTAGVVTDADTVALLEVGREELDEDMVMVDKLVDVIGFVDEGCKWDKVGQWAVLVIGIWGHSP